MARIRRSNGKRLLKAGAAVVALVVGYDLYKAHTNGPRPVRPAGS